MNRNEAHGRPAPPVDGRGTPVMVYLWREGFDMGDALLSRGVAAVRCMLDVTAVVDRHAIDDCIDDSGRACRGDANRHSRIICAYGGIDNNSSRGVRGAAPRSGGLLAAVADGA